MNKYVYTAFMIALAALASCKHEVLPVSDLISITAGFEDPRAPGQATDTKTHLSGTKVYWSSGDNAVYVFDSKGYKSTFTSTESSVKSTRTFTGTISQGAEISYVLYTGKSKSETDETSLTVVPGGNASGETITAGNDGTVVEWDRTKSGFPVHDIFSGSTLALPGTQNISTTNSFASATNIAIMKKGDTAMRSVFGYIRFTVPKGADGNAAIKSVKFQADEYMAGKIQIDYTDKDPVATVISNGSKSVTVNMRWNSTTSRYEDGTLYAILAPGTYHNLTITVTPFANGSSTQGAATATPIVLTSSKPVTVTRGKYTECGILPTGTSGSSSVFGQIVNVISSSVNSLFADTDKQILYAGMSGQVNVYDITSPMSPILKSTLSILGTARQICAYNGKLYVTARETGVWIFDLADDPLHPKFLRRFDSVELATGLDVAGDCMFVGQRNNGVEFVDVSNPKSPQHIRIIKTDESQSVFYQDGYLYSGEWNTVRVTIFDSHDLSNLTVLKTINLQGYGDGVWAIGNRLYASTGHHHRNSAPKTQDGDGHGLEIWDISNPADPYLISRTEFDIFYKSGTDCWLNRPSGDGKTLFCGDVFNGLYVLDISDETQPEILEHYALASGRAVTSLALADGVLYLAATGEGLLAMCCSRAVPTPRDRGTLPVHPEARYDYPTNSSHFVAWKPSVRGAVHSVASWGDALFVGCGNAGLYVVKVDRSSGVPVASTYSRVDIPYAGGVAVCGNRLYVSRGQDGIGVYNLSEGPSLHCVAVAKEELSSSSSKRYSCWISAPNDKYVINGVRYDGYQFLAVGGTETNPSFTNRGTKSQNVNYNKFISEQVCAGDLLPYATRDGLFWIDLSSSSSVTVSSMIEGILSTTSGGVTHFQNGSALISGGKSFYLVESGGETKTALGNNSDFSGTPRWDGDHTVLVNNFPGKYVSKVDFSSVSSPSLVYKESTEGNPEPGIFFNGKAIVPCGYQGLLIEK